MVDDGRQLVTTFISINTAIVSLDTTTQILHYFFTNWSTEESKTMSLFFIVLRPLTLLFIFLVYILFHSEKVLTIKRKIITLLIFIISMYIGYSPGAHMSFFSKYYLESESGIIISRVVNAFTFIFVTLPKILIIPINSSAEGSWNWIDIIGLCISSLNIIFLGVYYFMCNIRDFDFEIEMEDMSKIWDLTNESNYKYNESKENKENNPERRESNNKNIDLNNNTYENEYNDQKINKNNGIIKEGVTNKVTTVNKYTIDEKVRLSIDNNNDKNTSHNIESNYEKSANSSKKTSINKKNEHNNEKDIDDGSINDVDENIKVNDIHVRVDG